MICCLYMYILYSMYIHIIIMYRLYIYYYIIIIYDIVLYNICNIYYECMLRTLILSNVQCVCCFLWFNWLSVMWTLVQTSVLCYIWYRNIMVCRGCAFYWECLHIIIHVHHKIHVQFGAAYIFINKFSMDVLALWRELYKHYKKRWQ